MVPKIQTNQGENAKLARREDIQDAKTTKTAC